MKLVIRDSEWDRGSGQGYLLEGDTGRYCCLGLHARECGIPDDHLENRGPPDDILESLSVEDVPVEYRAAWLAGQAHDVNRRMSSAHAQEAMQINDDDTITDDERIERLRKIFAEVGIEIEWRPDE